MLELNIDCVHCGTLLSGNNYNTEHILDEFGENMVDNKMLMCKICTSPGRAGLGSAINPPWQSGTLVDACVL